MVRQRADRIPAFLIFPFHEEQHQFLRSRGQIEFWVGTVEDK